MSVRPSYPAANVRRLRANLDEIRRRLRGTAPRWDERLAEMITTPAPAVGSEADHDETPSSNPQPHATR